MVVTLRIDRLQNLEQIKTFLEGRAALGFDRLGREAIYGWLATELLRLASVAVFGDAPLAISDPPTHSLWVTQAGNP